MNHDRVSRRQCMDQIIDYSAHRRLVGITMLAFASVLSACGQVPQTIPPISTKPDIPEVPAPTDTPSPTRTETPTPVRFSACVTAGALNVRSGPGTGYTVVNGLANGDCIAIDARNADGSWVRIDPLWGMGLDSWVSAAYLQINGDPMELAGATLTPTPLPSATATSTPTPSRTPTPTKSPIPTRTKRPPPPPTAPPPTQNNCHPSYQGACLLMGIGDYDCGGGRGNGPNYVWVTVRVVGPDDFRLDGDGDGWGCE